MSGKYVSEKPTRGYNDRAPEVIRGERVTQEDFAKSGACRNLEPQTRANYGKKLTNNKTGKDTAN